MDLKSRQDLNTITLGYIVLWKSIELQCKNTSAGEIKKMYYELVNSHDITQPGTLNGCWECWGEPQINSGA